MNGLSGSNKGIPGKQIVSPCLCFFYKIQWIKLLKLAGKTCFEPGGIKACDRRGSAFSFKQTGLKFLNIIANRRKRAHICNYYFFHHSHFLTPMQSKSYFCK